LCRRRLPETVERDLIGAWQLPRVRRVRSPVAPLFGGGATLAQATAIHRVRRPHNIHTRDLGRTRPPSHGGNGSGSDRFQRHCVRLLRAPVPALALQLEPSATTAGQLVRGFKSDPRRHLQVETPRRCGVSRVGTRLAWRYRTLLPLFGWWSALHRGLSSHCSSSRPASRAEARAALGGRVVAPRPADRSATVRPGPEPTRVTGTRRSRSPRRRRTGRCRCRSSCITVSTC
jgi:hypothetical protein